jgi:hypothetical protein
MLLGCSAVPIQDDVTRKGTFQIVQQIRCEARRAVEQWADEHPGRNLPNAAIAYEFTFQITEGNSAMASATGLVPFLHPGMFQLVGAAGINDTRETTRNFRTVDTFSDLMNIHPRWCGGGELARDFIYPISGDIGMQEVVRTFIMLSRIDDPFAPAPSAPGTSGTAPTGTSSGTDVFTLADTLMFTTTLMAGLNPSLTLSPISRQFRLTSASAGLEAGRTDVHTVVVALVVTPQPKTTSVGLKKVPKPALGSSLRFSAVGSTSPSSVLTTTSMQAGATDPRDRALIELDRQRILALQARTPNLIVGP